MIKTNKIFTKIFIVMFFAILFFSILFSIYYITNQKNEILKSMEQEAKTMAKVIVYSISDAIVLNDKAFIVEFNNEFISQHELLDTIIISKIDKEYFYIKKDSWTYNNSLNDEIKVLEKKEPSSIIIKDSSSKSNTFHYSYPMIFSGMTWGYVHLGFSLQEYDKKISSMYVSFFIFFIVLLFITFLLSFYVAKNLSRPIISLNDIANKISDGNLDLRSTYKSHDEIGQLSKTFNAMISKIQSSQKLLKESYEKLEDRVEERTIELHEANRQLKDKTYELEILNKNLDNKVKEEVAKSVKQEALLIQQSRFVAMGEMLGNIAHQWRQPLSLISTVASGIKLEKEMGVSSEKKEIESLEMLINTSKYLSNTIEDFRNFFKPNKKEEAFFIPSKVEQSLDLVSASLKFHHIKVEKIINKNCKVVGFPNEFAQAVLNILSNAKDVLVERKIDKPLIKIRVYQEDNQIHLEIEDNAGGIKKDIMNKIFDPYFTTKHQSQGTGIGLYMSKMIIENNMNGTLSVKNAENGAVFTITLEV
ncbi:hypothetical protein CP965_06710 [Halarcobacter mediterraneus]|uniref:histidine kinase n=1 Tax=Halarcobacter mediterraneus TaxID=2023153 RepID=A0A4Q1AXI1_9BACT|nr:ATP-binding protein [Halarcobacter mediterraneus]RXK13488.1 hypothetical protein CP965_06710 [Halarcobacter mediterraneus]